MFSSKCNYPKLKTNLRLAVNRLKLMEKKKTELALKARKEIADYIQAGKEDRARIRVEHIVREDYMVEGMEILEMFCDLLLARFGVIERVSSLDPSIEEAVASIIWTEPRLSADLPELTVISKNLMARYGKEYHAACKANTLNNVNEKLMHKMSIYSPPKSLIENYMVEIAKSFNVDFLPDPLVMLGEDGGIPTANDLINFDGNKKNCQPPPPPSMPPSGPGGPQPPGGPGGYPPPPPGGPGGYPPPPPGGPGGYPPPPPGGPGGYPPPPPGGPGGNVAAGGPAIYSPPNDPAYPPAGAAGAFNYPPPHGGQSNAPPTQSPGATQPSCPPDQPPPSYSEKERPDIPPSYSSLGSHDESRRDNQAPNDDIPNFPEIPNDDFNLPSVPNSVNPGGPGNQADPNDIDFDDLAARFENLKKRK